MRSGYTRGHAIRLDGRSPYFVDTGERCWDVPMRSCKHCGKPPTQQGKDGCIGVLNGVVSACCGHGVVDQAYVGFENGEVLRGDDAWRCFSARGATPFNAQ